MTRERIDALENENQRLRDKVVELQARVDRLGPENARLVEALGNAESNSVFATIAVGVGGFLVSYATFTGNTAKIWANVAAGCLLLGIAMMAWQTVRRWRDRPH